jgi:hypothetical protein
MQPTPTTPPRTIEPRWPVALTIGVVLVLLTLLPDRIRVVPVWVSYLPGIAILGAIALVPITGGKPRSLRFERWITLLFCLFVGTGTLVGLRHLLFEMFSPSGDLDGLELFTSSVAVWVIGILIFALLYWQSDRGARGPPQRSSATSRLALSPSSLATILVVVSRAINILSS